MFCVEWGQITVSFIVLPVGRTANAARDCNLTFYPPEKDRQINLLFAIARADSTARVLRRLAILAASLPTPTRSARQAA